MLVEKNVINEPDGSVGYIESIFNSGNVLKTTYFPTQNRLYLAFNSGQVYSYSNIDNNLYEEFENAESQGKFFHSRIRSKPEEYIYRKEFTLYPTELSEIKEVVKKNLIKENENEI